MTKRYALTDSQWERIKDLLPGQAGQPGATARDNRLFIDAVLYRYRAGIPWRDLPEHFGDFRVVHTRHSRWSKTGVWQRVFEAFAQDADIVNLHNWSLGSFSGTTWSSVRAACICVTVIFVLVFLMSKPLSAYQLGESYALNLGVYVRLLRIGMVVFSSILSACVVAFAGPISFVGIAVPQLVKKMLGTAEPIWMIPASFLGGSVFCLFCDLLARTLFAPTELSISTVTAVFGAPVVLWVMAYGKKERVD